MSQRSLSRTPPPRQLIHNETLESLTHWRTSFRTFYKRDETFRIFFKPNAKWNSNLEHYGFNTTDDDDRQASELCEDFKDLLLILAGYLPNSYLTDKILNNTKNWNDVYEIIYEHYNVKVTSESLLDFESISKLSDETHRQFFERLLQHAKQHLAPKDVKVESIVNSVQDTMTISLMNMVALQWLRKCHPKLIDIVRIEYSTELRQNTQLAALVPRIAPNIDSLLRRYEKDHLENSSVNSIADIHLAVDKNPMVAKTSIWSRGTSYARGRGNQNRNSNRLQSNANNDALNKSNKNMFCPGCFYLSQQTNANINFRHFPSTCPRQSVTVKMLELEDQDYFPSEEDSSTTCDTSNVYEMLEAKVQRLEERKSVWKSNGVRKSKSPCIYVTLCGAIAAVAFLTVDEGSEINCIDESYAIQHKIKYVPTSCKAVAAGSTSMKLAGQTSEDISFK